jgi:putative oxidoreductase
MDGLPGINELNGGLLVARVVLGLLIAGHGAQKLFGWFGGYGVAGTGGFFEQVGFRPGRAFAAAAGVGEFGGGLLVALGLLGPIGPALVVSVMIVAAGSVHWGHGVFAPKGIEVPLLYGATAAALALTGPGGYSLDALTGLSAIWTPTISWIALIVGVAGAAANLAARHAPAAVTA